MERVVFSFNPISWIHEFGVHEHNNLTVTRMQLKDRPCRNPNQDGSDTLYVRGLPRAETEESVLKLLSVFAPPIEYDFSSRLRSGEVWAKYTDVNIACKTIQKLHHTNINGSILSVKYELGVDANGKRIVDRSSHTTIIRRIGPRKEGEVQPTKKQKVLQSCAFCTTSTTESTKGRLCTCANRIQPPGNIKSTTSPGVSYTSNSICVNTLEYPFPSGVYLARVIELTNRVHVATNRVPVTPLATLPAGTDLSDPLLAILSDTRSMGNKYAKEISEAMAMVDAIQRAISLLPPTYKSIATSANSTATQGNDSLQLSDGEMNDTNESNTGAATPVSANQVRVYVLGDGKRPLCAAAACLHLPGHYSFYSVDPLMMPLYSCQTTKSATNELVVDPCNHFGAYQDRFFPLALMSQDFQVPALADCSTDGSAVRTLSIVVSCHSHAPLQEFWDRLQGPKVAVTMACCASYAALFAAASNSITASDSMVATSVLSAASDDADDRRVTMNLPVDSISRSKRANKRGKAISYREPLIPILEFEDFEVYSPKRTVKIYFDL